MELLTVGELSRRSGVPISTLRYYDSLGLLVPRRLANTHRRYPVESVLRLHIIKLCQALGCDLAEIRELVQPGRSADRQAAARREIGRVDRRLQELAAIRRVLSHFAECTCATGHDCQMTIEDALGELRAVGARQGSG